MNPQAKSFLSFIFKVQLWSIGDNGVVTFVTFDLFTLTVWHVFYIKLTFIKRLLLFLFFFWCGVSTTFFVDQFKLITILLFNSLSLQFGIHFLLFSLFFLIRILVFWSWIHLWSLIFRSILLQNLINILFFVESLYNLLGLIMFSFLYHFCWSIWTEEENENCLKNSKWSCSLQDDSISIRQI